MKIEAMAKEAGAVSERVHSLIKAELAGRGPELQGAILADMLAMWLAGHIVHDDEAATAALRSDLLAEHIKIVRQLIEVNHKIIHG